MEQHDSNVDQQDKRSWRESPLRWFENWTSQPLALEQVLAAVLYASTPMGDEAARIFKATLATRVAGYPELPWAQLTGRALLASTIIGVSVTRHIETTFTEPFDSVPVPERLAIYASVLMLHERLHGGGDDSAAGPELASAAMECAYAVPYLDTELRHRCGRHPGVRAAMIVVARYLDRDDGLLRALSPLIGSVAKRTRTRRTARADVRNRDLASERAEALSELAVTVCGEWGADHPLSVVAEALDGRLNIASRRAGDRLANGDRQPCEKAQRELREALRSNAPPRADDVALSRIGLDRLASSRRGDELRRALAALGDDATQAQLAAFHGVTERTIRNWQSSLREEFDF